VNEYLAEVMALTLREYSSKIADNITNNIPLLMRLNSRGNVRTFDGGTHISENIQHDGGEAEWYSGYDIRPPEPSDGIKTALFDIRQLRSPVTASGLEEAQNSGRSKIADIVKTRVRGSQSKMRNALSTGIYSTGLAGGGKQIDGLGSLVVQDPTSGKVGGLDRAAFSFWRNKVLNAGNVNVSNIRSVMNALYQMCKRDSDVPDLISLGMDLFNLLWETSSDQQRFQSQNSEFANIGIDTLRFNGADVLMGGGVGGDNPAGVGYFLNTDFLSLRPHRDKNMVPRMTGQPYDQDSHVEWVYWYGNMCASNLSLQGYLHN